MVVFDRRLDTIDYIRQNNTETGRQTRRNSLKYKIYKNMEKVKE